MKYEIRRKIVNKGLLIRQPYVAVCVDISFSEDELETIYRNKMRRAKILDRFPADGYAVEDVSIYALTIFHLMRATHDCHCCRDEDTAANYETELIEALDCLNEQLSAGASGPQSRLWQNVGHGH